MAFTNRIEKWCLLTIGIVLACGIPSFSHAQTNTFPNSGNVGIGTLNPAAGLEINGTDTSTITLLARPAIGQQVDAFRVLNRTGAISTRVDEFGNVLLGPGPVAYIKNNGNVGIGTTIPEARLHIAGDAIFKVSDNVNNRETVRLQQSGQGDITLGFRVSGQSWVAGIDNSDGKKFKIAANNALDNDSVVSLTIDANRNVGIGTTSPTSKLHVSGNARITGNLTTDGNITAKYQDVAEWVPAFNSLSPGTVVVIHPQETNHVLPSFQAYDARVAGVVSAQPGIILGEPSGDKVKVAHSGRVKVRADAQYGPIKAGDLLVSSTTPGYAMRSTPVNFNGISMHRPGTIIGKALEPLADGQGEILVLVTLQ